jgi:hypothetical protein
MARERGASPFARVEVSACHGAPLSNEILVVRFGDVN